MAIRSPPGSRSQGWKAMKKGLQLLAWEKPTALFWAKTHFRKSSRQSASPEGASELQVPEVSASGRAREQEGRADTTQGNS